MTVPSKETMTIEFISDMQDCPEDLLADEIVAMSNAGGGTVYLGIEDDGTVTGLRDIHKDTEWIQQVVSSRILPGTMVSARFIQEDGMEVMQIEIPEYSYLHCTADGRYAIRYLQSDGTPSTRPMNPAELESWYVRKTNQDPTAMPMLNASMDDLDLLQLIRLRNVIRSNHGDPALPKLDNKELLEELGMIQISGINDTVVYPTFTGLLLAGREEKMKELLPGVEYAFQVIEGTAVRVNKHYRKPLLEMLEILESRIDMCNFEQEVMDGFFRIGIPRFSMQAIHEGLINAFCHRDYTVYGTVRIQIDNEGITITSPGSFANGIDGSSIHALLHQEPKSRNMHLSNVLKRIGLSRQIGQGMDRIFEETICCGRPWPDYSESTNAYVRLYLPDTPADEKFMLWLSRTQKKYEIGELLILSLLRTGEKSGKEYSLEELAEKIGIGIPEAEQKLDELYRMNMIKAVEQPEGKKWLLNL